MTTRTAHPTAFVFAVALVAAACAERSRPPLRPDGATHLQQIAKELDENAREIDQLDRRHLARAADRDVFIDAAKAAWAFADSHYHPSSGMMGAVGQYPYVTIWDVGSMVAALFCARGLDLIDQATYQTRMTKLLDRLRRMPLYDGAVFNKMYDSRSGGMVNRNEQPTSQGFGWSATDLGRLLIWLKIVSERDESFRAAIDAIVTRNDLARVVKHGYLTGEDLRGGRPHTYQEARIGYEQYAARGFALWGQRAERALDINANALPLWVNGQRFVADYRGDDRLTSEPYFLMGLETGWDAQIAAFARALLYAQQARYEKTGTVTLISEDAIAQPPSYFYYYCLFTNGMHYGVDVQDQRLTVDGPRWVSTKGAFAYHALMPNWYTQVVVDRVGPARSAGGWASGVFEGSGQSTGTANINTAAVVLAAALYAREGQPLILKPAPATPN